MAWGRLALIEAAKVSPNTLAQVAKVFDYEKQTQVEERKSDGVVTDQKRSDEPAISTTTGKQQRSTGRFVRITKIEPLTPEKEQPHDYLYDPQQQLKPDHSSSGTYQFEAPRPLLSDAQLIPFLHNSLGLKHAGNKVDQRVLGRLVSKGQPIQKLPFKAVQRWPQQLQIIVDTGDHLRPYWKDFERMITLLKKVLGSNNVSAIRLREANQRRQKALCIEWPTQQDAQWSRWHIPASDVSVLILSDFGVTEKTGNHSGLWWRFVRDLYFHPAPVITLSPVASAPLSCVRCQRLSISPLRDGTSLPRHALKGFEQPTVSSEKIQAILILLSPLPIIDTGLLRKLRDAFQWGNSALEGQLWNHPDMQVGSLGIRLKPSLAKTYAKQFRREVSQQDATLLWEIVEAHHKDAYQGLKQLELIGQSVASNCDNQHVRHYLKQLSASTAQSIRGSAQHNALIMQCKTYLASQPDDIWNGDLSDVFYDLCAMAYEADIKAGELPPMLGDHFRPERLKWLLDEKERQEYVSWSVRQLGVSGEMCFEQVSSAIDTVSPVYRFEALKKIPPTLHLQESVVKSLRNGLVCKVAQLDKVEVRTETEVLHFDVMPKPDWATAIGRDQYGLYADINLTPEHLQRFRWIPAGTFMMGSPESEVKRYSDEAHHQVTLTEGYWLADTTVTQGQWQAISGTNPSHFKGENRPVETVSWDDAQSFIKTINTNLPYLEFGLPTEAQWEYACRAGTTTPFSFGNNIKSDQVNYNGDYPYSGGDKGDSRRKVVSVKSLPANPWGLYEMHGNVWEWCQDIWQSERLEAEEGIRRVIRGGSWRHNGKEVCSASRRPSSPGLRGYDLGFRLFLVNPSGGATKFKASKSRMKLYEQVISTSYPNELEEEFKLLLDKAVLAMSEGNFGLAKMNFEKVLSNQREIGDEEGEGVTLNNLSHIYRIAGDFNSALGMLQRAYEISQKHGDEVNQFVTLGNISGIYYLQERYQDAEPVLEQALSISRNAGDKNGEHTILCEMARLNMAMGRFNSSLEYLDLARNIAFELNEWSLIADTLSELSRVYVVRGDYSRALEYISLELEKRRESADIVGEGDALYDISQVYKLQRNFDNAIWYSEQSLNIKIKLGDKPGEAKALNNLASIFQAQGRFEKGLKCFHSSLEIMRETGDVYGEGTILNDISQLYAVMSDFGSAKKFLDDTHELVLKTGDQRLLFTVLKNYAELYLKQEQVSAAIEYFYRAREVARKLGDTRFDQLVKTKLNELQGKNS